MKVETKKDWLIFLWMFNIIGVGISGLMTFYKGKTVGYFLEKNSQTFHECFTFINCISIFLTIKYLFRKGNINKYVKKFVLSIGECTFGIYLIHLLIMECEPMKKLLDLMINTKINQMIIVFLWCFIIMIISYGITYILRKIPIIKKLVGG